MTKKHQAVRQLLAQTAEEEIQITAFPDGRARVDFTVSADTPQAVDAWKKALSQTAGLWADRPDIAEEMTAMRKEADGGFL